MNHHTFAPRLLTWFETHGRHDLPWQYHHNATANIYAVWLSEIMLQQTQVATVLKYFEKFMKKFDTVEQLAVADWNEVATLWAGLGYYARARNLHKGAKQVVDFIEKTGDFPQTTDDWQSISGVGRSTAGAIVAMGVRGRGVICDGNVKRVLTRWAGIDGDIGKSATDKELWKLADTLTPIQDSGKYAQAIMDLGATICTRTRPNCTLCPLSADCTAHQEGCPTAYPVKAKKVSKPHRHSLALAICHDGQFLWIKRNNNGGIWDGLYAFPLIMTNHQSNQSPISLDQVKNAHEMTDNTQAPSLAERQVLDGLPNLTLNTPTTIKHTLTHFHWHLSPVLIDVDETSYNQINQSLKAIHADFIWQKDHENLGVPKAMEKILHQLLHDAKKDISSTHTAD